MSKTIQINTAKGFKVGRAYSELGQKAAAEQIGITQNYLSLLEHGHSTPSLDVLVRAANVYGLRPSLLLQQSEQSTPQDERE